MCGTTDQPDLDEGLGAAWAGEAGVAARPLMWRVNGDGVGRRAALASDLMGPASVRSVGLLRNIDRDGPASVNDVRTAVSHC